MAFLVAQVVLYLAAVHAGYGSQYFDASSWARGDSVQYLSIADHGYSVFRCTGNLYPPNSWCGNDAWLPLYPGLMELMSNLGLSHLQGGADISAFMSLAMFGLLWQLIGPSWSTKPMLALALAAVFPGQVYFFSVFPISLALVCSLAFLLFLSRRRYVWAGLAGAIGVWAYSGILLVPVALAFVLFFDQAKSTGERMIRSLRRRGIDHCQLRLHVARVSDLGWQVERTLLGWVEVRPHT